ncbi:MAG: hypothetical protein ACR2O6_12110 [Ilumatobacteraceae bacterium]
MTLVDPPDHTVELGARVEVRSRFEQRWSRGFEVVGAEDDGYRVRRLSDDEVLPTVFGEDEIRKERNRGTWWY